MSWIMPVVSGAATLYGALHQNKNTNYLNNVQGINARYMGMNPGGELSSEDLGQVNRTQLAGTQAAARGGALGRISAYRQAQARGLSGASAAALVSNADQGEAANREGAAMGAANQAYQMYGSNRDFNREKMMTGWGNEVGAATRDVGNANAQNSTFWNSALESIPAIASMWKPGGGGMSQSLNPNDYGGTAGTGALREANYSPLAVPNNDRPWVSR